MFNKKKNTYESTDVIYHGGMKYGADIHGVTLKVNKIIWDMIKKLEADDLYGYHFMAKIGVHKSIVIIRHDEEEMLDKAKVLLKVFYEIDNLLILLKQKTVKESNKLKLWLMSIGIILTLVAVGIGGYYYYKSEQKRKVLEEKVKVSTSDEPIIETVEIDIRTLKALQETFVEENSPSQVMITKVMEITTDVISDMVPDSMKKEYSSEAVVKNFKGKSGIQFVLKDHNMSEEFNQSVEELQRYAMGFVEDNNFSGALKCYDAILRTDMNQTQEEIQNAVSEELNDEKMAEVLSNMGDAYRQMDALKKAESAYEQSLEITQKLSKKNVQKYAAAMALSLSKLAHTRADLNQTFVLINQLEQTELVYTNLVEVNRKLARKNPLVHEENLAWSLNRLANFYHEEKRDFNQSIEIRKEALNLYKKLVKEDSKKFIIILFQTLNSLAKTYMVVEQNDLAQKSYEKALSVIQEMLKEDESHYKHYLALAFNNLGYVHQRKAAYTQSEKYYKEALALYEVLVKEDATTYEPYWVFVKHDLASVYAYKKEFTLAKQEYDKVFLSYKKLSKMNPLKYLSKMVDVLHHLAWVEIAQGNIKKMSEAKNNVHQAITLAKRMSDTHTKQAKEIEAQSDAYLAQIAILEKQAAEALKYYEKSLNLVKSFNVEKSYVQLLAERKMYKKARSRFESMLKEYPQKEQQAEIWMRYGKFYWEINPHSAKGKLNKSLSIYQELDEEKLKIYPQIDEIKILLENNTSIESN